MRYVGALLECFWVRMILRLSQRTVRRCHTLYTSGGEPNAKDQSTLTWLQASSVCNGHSVCRRSRTVASSIRYLCDRAAGTVRTFLPEFLELHNSGLLRQQWAVSKVHTLKLDVVTKRCPWRWKQASMRLNGLVTELLVAKAQKCPKETCSGARQSYGQAGFA